MSNFLPGLKTYIGLAVTLMGALAQQLGWDWWGLISADVTTGANMVVELIGLAIAAYGRAVAKPKTT